VVERDGLVLIPIPLIHQTSLTLLLIASHLANTRQFCPPSFILDASEPFDDGLMLMELFDLGGKWVSALTRQCALLRIGTDVNGPLM
jgi:hypothetical protein